MPTHTPGPWAVRNGTVYGNGYRSTVPMNSADAALIAAAPEMYEALKAIMAGVAGCVRNPEYEAARAAIARAEGK